MECALRPWVLKEWEQLEVATEARSPSRGGPRRYEAVHSLVSPMAAVHLPTPPRAHWDNREQRIAAKHQEDARSSVAPLVSLEGPTR